MSRSSLHVSGMCILLLRVASSVWVHDGFGILPMATYRLGFP